jgi:spore photoproduct lyase
MQAKDLLNIDTLYVDPSALDYERGREIFEKYEDVPNIVEVDSHWRIEELNNNPDLVASWNRVKSHYLVLGVKQSISSRPNTRSTDWIAPSQTSGCAMACSYCYVARRKGYANPITVFANIEKIKRHIARKCDRIGPKIVTQELADKFSTKACTRSVEDLRQTDPHLWTWDIGENSDCSVDDLVSDNIKDLIELFATIPNAKASFATKFVNRNLLNYDPKGHTRIRFSLMPSHVAKVVDVRTSPIEDRIAAINDFVDAGYEVHINLSPIIIYDGWQSDYVDLFRQLDDSLSDDAKKQLKAEVIFLTHNERLHQINMQWHPKAEEEYLWRHWESKDDKTHNRFGHEVIQQKKLSQNGMVNLRYKNNHKRNGCDTIRTLMEEHIPYCGIRYIF